MGLLDGAMDVLGLSADFNPAISAAEFDPYNITSGTGSLTYDEDSRTFTSQLSPEYQALINQWMPQLSQINPNQQLDLYRQMAAPYEEQQRLGLENRLFSQGRLGHSQVDQPGGARRSLFDAQANADLQRQSMAQNWANQQRQALLSQIMGVQGLEGGLFNAGLGFGGLGMQGQNMQSQLMAQQAQFQPQLLGGLLTGGIAGFMAG